MRDEDIPAMFRWLLSTARWEASRRKAEREARLWNRLQGVAATLAASTSLYNGLVGHGWWWFPGAAIWAWVVWGCVKKEAEYG